MIPGNELRVGKLKIENNKKKTKQNHNNNIGTVEKVFSVYRITPPPSLPPPF